MVKSNFEMFKMQTRNWTEMIIKGLKLNHTHFTQERTLLCTNFTESRDIW